MAILQQYSDLLLRGRVSVGYTYFTGLAKMDIAPGSASLAPLRVTPGTLLSSTVSGAIENDGDNLYWTDSDGVRSPLLSTVNYSQYGLSVLQASRLSTGRYIGIGGGVTAEASQFNGESDLILQVSSVNADYLVGSVPIDALPTGTTSSTVALGNHMHLYAGSASAGGPATTALACTGNSATATKLETTRALTIGNTAKNFDGSAAVSWTLAEIGANQWQYGQYGSGSIKTNSATATGLRSGDGAKPYVYWGALAGQDLKAGGLAGTDQKWMLISPSTVATYAYGGEEYTYNNATANYVFLILIDSADFIGSATSPFNLCRIIANAGTNYLSRYRTILTVGSPITGNVYPVIVTTGSSTAPSGITYTESVSLYVPLKTSAPEYSGNYSVASGANSIASGYASVASGNASVASGNESIASGGFSIASGNASVSSGRYSIASGERSVASGNASVASGGFSVASGSDSVASGYASVASGAYSVASGGYTVASGRYSVAAGDSQTVIGKHNVADTSSAFIIGNGTSPSARSNCMTVDFSGNMTLAGALTLSNRAGANRIAYFDSAGTLQSNASYTLSSFNAATAAKLETARTISLTGSVTGSVSFDGSGDVSITTTTNHTHSYLPTAGGTVSGELKVGTSRPFIVNRSGAYGNVFIQGSTGGWAFAYGALGIEGTNLGGFGFYGNADTLNSYYIGIYSSDEKISILSNGNVGIGNTSPSTKLDVNGTVTASSFSGVGSSITSLNASNLSSGSVPIARLPVGTASTEVAYGNHTHSYLPLSGGTLTGALTGTSATLTGTLTAGTINGSGLTASSAVITDASKNLVSSTVTSEQIGYLSAVTSSVQGQLDGKLGLISGGTVYGATSFRGIVSHGRDYYNVLTFSGTVTFTEILIKTRIPYINGHIMPVIRIFGYAFGAASPIDLNIAFYIWGGNFYNSGCMTACPWGPVIKLFTYDDSGTTYVGVALMSSIDYPRFSVSYQDIWTGDPRGYATGWTIETNTTATSIVPSDNLTTVPYRTIANNAASATKLATARTISLTGSVTGSVSFDGSGDVSITTTTNHTHSGYATSTHNHDSTYLKLSGGTVTGKITLDTNGGIFKSGWEGNRIAYFVSGDLTTSADYTLSSFALAGHNHDGVYSPTSHTHSGYAASTHSHSITDLYCGVPDIVPGRILISGSGALSNPTWLDAGENGKILGWTSGAPAWVDVPDHNHDSTYLKLSGGTLTGALTGTSATLTGTLTAGTLNGSGLTASRVVVTDGSKNLSSSTATATEVGYLSGVSGAIQTQLDSRYRYIRSFATDEDANDFLTLGCVTNPGKTITNLVGSSYGTLATLCGTNFYRFQFYILHTGSLYKRGGENSWGNWSLIYDSVNANLTTVDWSAKDLTLSGSITGATTVTATSFVGEGSSITSLNASNLSSGTVPIGRLPTGTTSTTVAFGDHTHAYSPTSHASSANTYGLATASLYGHAMASSATPLVAGTASVGTDNGKFAREDHVHPAQTSVSGSSASCTGNAATATKLATARTLTIGNTGKDFDGSANVTWSLADIGANQWKDGQYGAGSIMTNSATATGLRSGDEAKPYVYWRALSGQDLKAGGLAGIDQKWMLISPSSVATYAYGGVEYTYDNATANYVFLILVDNADFIGSATNPLNRCRIIANAGTNYLFNYRTILTVGSPITGNVYPVIVSTGSSTAPSGITYTESVSLYAPLKTSAPEYSGDASVASGAYSVASGRYSVASGYSSIASGHYSIASGYSSIASGEGSVASGPSSVASSYASVASGGCSVASGSRSFASGEYSVASGLYSVASGAYSIASGDSQTVIGKYNVADTSSAFIIGNGTSPSARSNCMTVDFSGNMTLAGALTLSNRAGANRIAYFDSAGILQSNASYTLSSFNAATAAKLATARTISLTGSVTGSVSFDGSGDVSITTETNHTHSYLPLSGGTLTGALTGTSATLTGTLGVSGVATLPKIFINRASNAASGISFYSSSYNAWQIYMADAAQTSLGVRGTLTAPGGTYVTSWALRSVIESLAGYGWTWESGSSSGTSPSIVAELSSNTGNFKTIGSLFAVGGTFTGAVCADAGARVSNVGSSWISGKTSTNCLYGRYSQTTTEYHPFLRINSSSGNVFNLGGLGNNIGFYGYYAERTENGTDWSTVWDTSTGALTHNKALTVSGATVLSSTLSVSSTVTFTSLSTAGVVHNSAAGVLSTGKVALASEVSGTLGVGNGGTGRATLTANSLLYGDGTSSIGMLAIGGASTFLKSTGSGYEWVSIRKNDSSEIATLSTTKASPTAITYVSGDNKVYHLQCTAPSADQVFYVNLPDLANVVSGDKLEFTLTKTSGTYDAQVVFNPNTSTAIFRLGSTTIAGTTERVRIGTGEAIVFYALYSGQAGLSWRVMRYVDMEV